MKRRTLNSKALITTVDQFGAIVATKVQLNPSYTFNTIKAKAIKKMRKERLI